VEQVRREGMLDFTRIKAVFFDVDDTLYDQLDTFRRAVECWSVDIGDLSVEALFKQLRHHSDLLWSDYKSGALSLEVMRLLRIKQACEAHKLDITDEEAQHFQECYEEEQAKLEMHPEALPLIKGLIERGITVGILTNGPVAHQLKKIEQFKLREVIPDRLVYISDGLGIAKPDLKVFQHINQTAEVPPEHCCYIGDSWENDIASSTEAGWQSIWINHRGRTPETEHVPAAIIKHFNELIKLFKSDPRTLCCSSNS
jgi:HAD superfamily hydrolase (TIGR01549 family)